MGQSSHPSGRRRHPLTSAVLAAALVGLLALAACGGSSDTSSSAPDQKVDRKAGRYMDSVAVSVKNDRSSSIWVDKTDENGNVYETFFVGLYGFAAKIDSDNPHFVVRVGDGASFKVEAGNGLLHVWLSINGEEHNFAEGRVENFKAAGVNVQVKREKDENGSKVFQLTLT